MGRRLALLAALLCCAVAASPASADTPPSRCSACRAVADELVRRLEAETPRNHLDLQHRVGPDGKRWGKVIDYKMSELRVIHLLEDLCEGLGSKYDLVAEPQPTGAAGAAGTPPRQRWVRTELVGIGRSFDLGSGLKAQRRELDNFCADMVERHEDALSLALRSGEADPDSTSDLLCLTTAKHCEQPLAAEEAARAAAEAAEVEVTHAQLEAAQAAADAADTEQQAGAEGAEQQAGADAAAGTAAGSTAGSVKQEGKEEL